MKYITLFDAHYEYEAAKNNLLEPNVSHCVREAEVHFKPQPPHDYSKDCLTFVVTTGGDINWNGSTTANTLSYSKDNGATWATADSSTTISVVVGDIVLWKGTATPSGSGIGRFSGTSAVRYDVEGNVMSLLYGDNFSGQTSLDGKTRAFQSLFASNVNIVNANNMILPATTVANYSYLSMFNGCTSLITSPKKIPVETMSFCCCDSMFRYCSSLTTTPELPATTLSDGCYQSMFAGCTSLTTAPELPAPTMAQYCCASMFEGCSSLNSITCLATNISAAASTTNWVNGVAADGVFTKASSMTSWLTGNSGIPSNWTVKSK